MEIVNLLAFIQILTTFDFGLFIIEESSLMKSLYKRYQTELRAGVDNVMIDSARAIRSAMLNGDEECKRDAAVLNKTCDLLKYRIDPKNVDCYSSSFSGLYAGIYGIVAMFCLGVTKGDSDFLVETFILIFAQVILLFEILILCNNHFSVRPVRNRITLWSHLKATMIIFVISWIVIVFDCYIDYFHNFESPFITLTVLILLMPILIFIHDLISGKHFEVLGKIRCKHLIKKINNSIAFPSAS